MDRVWIALLLCVQLLCLGLLWVSCFPGAIVDASLPLILLLYWLLTSPVGLLIVIGLPALGFALWARHRWGSQLLREQSRQRIRRSLRKQVAIITCFVVLLTSVLLRFNLPQAIAFSISRPAFEAFITDSTKVELCGQNFKQQLGLYRVEGCDNDSRGGIYFKTGFHGFLFDSASYGFVYRPNSHGSERFGSDKYEYHVVAGDWYWFKAGQDW